MRKIAILGNKRAGRGVASSQAFYSRSKLWGRQCEYYFPRSLNELREVCLGLSPDTHDALVVIGGDGTMNQVIRSFTSLPNQVPIYPFPGGTANDLARELGLDSDWNQVQTLVDSQQTDQVDLIGINGTPFVTVGGIGMGSTLVSEFNRRRKDSAVIKTLAEFLQSQIYTLLSAKTILLNRSYIHRLRIRAPGFDEIIRTPAVFLCNQTQLGGNLTVAPTIDNTDRRFNVLIVTTCMRAKLLSGMAQLKMGKLPSDFFVFSSDHVVIEDLNGRRIRAFGDGELLGESSHLECHVIPRSLLVYRSPKRTWDHSRRMMQ